MERLQKLTLQTVRRRARPIWQVVSQNDEGILIEDNIWNLDKACQLCLVQKMIKVYLWRIKVMSWKTTCIEVLKNATDGVDDMDETFKDEFKDYSKK